MRKEVSIKSVYQRLVLLLVVLTCLLPLALSGCWLPPESALDSVSLDQHHEKVFKFDFSRVSTVDNSTYIPLNLRGELSDLHPQVQECLKQFGELHQDWEMTSLTIDYYRASAESKTEVSVVNGLWLLHRLKKGVPAKVEEFNI